MDSTVRTCPRCGAQMKIEENAVEAVCERCKTVLRLEEADSAPEQGAVPESIESARESLPEEERPAQAEPTPEKKSHLLWWVMGWFFIFPLPATILIARRPGMKKSWKALWIVLLWGLYLAIGLAGKDAAR